MPEDNSNHKKRKMEYESSYSEMTLAAAEERLGFDLQKLVSEATPVDRMLEQAKCGMEDSGKDDIEITKEKVICRIQEYLQFEGYPTEAGPDFKRANINDLILYTIGPILWDFNFILDEGDVLLRREKEIISPDSKTGGYGEFVVVEEPGRGNDSLILIVESKPSLGEAIKHCLLAMKDMWSTNGSGKVYGFVTTGEDWRMVSYDGITFEMTEKFTVLSTSESRDRWTKEGSVLVDCIIAALRSGGK